MRSIDLLFSSVLLLTSCSAEQSITSEESIHSFEVGNKCFMLDSNEFLIRSAELHYSRVPEQYWDHRIKMCKALGMNTISTYVFWNYHEPEEGQFDFTGNKDIRKFCKIAQDNGMYVILRPGPFVCSEWEMGGLPWWLLKNKGIKLRSSDPRFLNPVKKYMSELGNQLADLQITRGGNIIMVQVENEFSYYATDKDYMNKLKNIIISSGFSDVPLFECDWMSNFDQNALDDLLCTMNYGTGCDIDAQFSRLKSLRPNSPLMCSEFWSGWFDKWGHKHETRPADVMVSGIKEMNDKGISYSLYMTHGGTTFGYYNGANDNPYSPLCNSYDYDAPISETGNTTQKFELLRSLMKNYVELSEVPNPIDVYEIPQFRLNESVEVFKCLPDPIQSHEIKPMEEFDLGYGSIMYRKILTNNFYSGSVISINEVHDYALVYINRTKVAELDRRLNQNSFTLINDIHIGDTLDIYVEESGRLNFCKNLADYKGITKSVFIDDIQIYDWLIYRFPFNYEFVYGLKFDKLDSPSNVPTYYRGYFTVNEVHDTFLNLSNFNKGFIWVNGIPLSRIWNLGPQNSCYLPGGWIKNGRNEVVVLDYYGVKDPVISGITAPIYNKCQVIDNSKKIDLSGANTIDIKLRNVGIPNTVKFSKSMNIKYIYVECNNVNDMNIFIDNMKMDLIERSDEHYLFEINKSVNTNSIKISVDSDSKVIDIKLLIR